MNESIRLSALTRPPGDSLAECELTYLERAAIDVERARTQHRAYEDALRSLGVQVVSLPPDDDAPDACFLEDTAVVLDEIAILARPGAQSRRHEVEAIAPVLQEYRNVERIAAPATLDGGDVLVVARTIYVGVAAKNPRTNTAGADALRALAGPFGYDVRTVRFTECLHLKTAATYVGRGTLLFDPRHVPADAFSSLEVIEVDRAEPTGANALLIGDSVVMPASAPATTAMLRRRGFSVQTIDISEFEKAEAGVTCLSLIIHSTATGRAPHGQ